MSKINTDHISIEIQLKNKGAMRALIAIEYAGMRITHFRIMEQDGEIWLEPPSISKGWGKFSKCFWIPDDEDFRRFNQLVLGKYHRHLDSVKDGNALDNTPLEELKEIPDEQ